MGLHQVWYFRHTLCNITTSIPSSPGETGQQTTDQASYFCLAYWIKRSEIHSGAPQKINEVSAQQYWQRTLMETAKETVRRTRSDELSSCRLPKNYQFWNLPWVCTTPFSCKHSKKWIIVETTFEIHTKVSENFCVH